MDSTSLVSMAGLASVTAFLVIFVELLKRIQDFFGGSPEMRAIRSQLDAQNTQYINILRNIAAKLELMAKKWRD